MSETNDTRLAIRGGPPAVSGAIPAWPPFWPTVHESVNRVLADGSWGQYHGPAIDEFTRSFAAMLDQPHVWPCSSGTIAVELALRGCHIRPGDEVMLAGYDFSGNFRAIEAVGGRPALVDVQANGYVLDVALLENAFTPDTRAVIVSHLHGQLADVEAIHKICASRSIAVIEDACQVPGAVIAGRAAGTRGDVGVFSFGGSKLLTAGRGGAVVTRSEQILQRVRIAAERGNDACPLSTLQAAALLPQLQVLDDYNRTRQQAATRIRRALTGSRRFRPLSDPWNAEQRPAFYKFAIQIPDSVERQPLIDALNAEGVPADAGFRGFTRRSPRRCRRSGSLENSTRATEKTILIHHPVLLGDAELVDQIILGLRKVDRGFGEA